VSCDDLVHMGRARGAKAKAAKKDERSGSWLLTALVIFAALVALRAVATDDTWQSWSDDPLADRQRHFADPGVLRIGDDYVAYGTTADRCSDPDCPTYWVPRYSATSLKNQAELRDDAMPARPAWVDPGNRDIWAPSVARAGEQYVMYFAATAGPGGPHAGAKCLGLATSASPDGEFVPSPVALWCVDGGFWALDPYPVVDGTRLFLLWREDDAANVRGKIVAAELTADGLGFAGLGPKPTLMVGEAPWEDGAAGGGVAGSGIGPIENPAMARHPDTGEWLLTWSANRWETRDYATGLARCDTPLGPCTRMSREEPWLRTSHDPSIQTSASFSGIGGLTFVTDDSHHLYVVFHAYRDDAEEAAEPGSTRVAWAYRVDSYRGTYRLTEF
jgi:glycosyl hydrolase family 43